MLKKLHLAKILNLKLGAHKKKINIEIFNKINTMHTTFYAIEKKPFENFHLQTWRKFPHA
jgi:hypothetical protein